MDAIVDQVPQTQPPPFVPREDQAALIAAALAAVRKSEGARRWENVITNLSGWLVAATMIVPFGYTLAILKNRPVPQDRIWVSMMHSDGSTEPAKADLTPSEREAAISAFMFNYVDYRRSYDFNHLKYNYDRARFTTAPEAQEELKTEMRDSPDSPFAQLGVMGERRISDITPSRTGPDSFEVSYTERIKSKEGIWDLSPHHRRARITYAISVSMPAEIAHRLDPLRAVVTRFDDHPAAYDPATGGQK